MGGGASPHHLGGHVECIFSVASLGYGGHRVLAEKYKTKGTAICIKYRGIWDFPKTGNTVKNHCSYIHLQFIPGYLCFLGVLVKKSRRLGPSPAAFLGTSRKEEK